jgi:CRISPR-associated endonuclease/helicase Cas3
VLLHSRFFRRDRSDKEERIRKRFGKGCDWDGVAVSTQVIEAGMDLSCDQEHVTLCPMNALVQRAGRCVRFPPDGDIGKAEGVVHVYHQPEEGRWWLPYAQGELERTWEVLKAHDGEEMDPETLAGWVEEVHGEKDRLNVSAGSYARRQECLDRIRQNSVLKQWSSVSELIRGMDEVRTARCVIARNPPSYLYSLDGLPMALYAVKKLIETGGASAVHGWSVGDDGGQWEALTEPGQAFGRYLGFCLAPGVARYTREMGLQIGLDGQLESPSALRVERTGYSGGLRKELWRDHSRGVAGCLGQRAEVDLHDGSLLAAGLLQRYGISASLVRDALRYTGLLHDAGKLQAGWQRWAWAYQAAKQPGYHHEHALAHTDFDSGNPRDVALTASVTGQLGPRGEHAAAGALAASVLIKSLLAIGSKADLQVALACVAAILGHHGAAIGRAGEVKWRPVTLWPGWRKEVSEVVVTLLEDGLARSVEGLGGGQAGAEKLASYINAIAGPDALEEWWPLVAHLTRTLRLSDQKATSEGADVP